MPNSGRYGKKESGLSLIQIDAGKEWRGGQRQSFFLARELARKDYPFSFYVQPESPLHIKAESAGLPVVPLRMKSEWDLGAVLRLTCAMRRRRCRLVHFHEAHSVTIGSAAAGLAGVPIKVISRRVDFPLKQNVFSRRKYGPNVDMIVAISEGVKKVLIESGIEPARIKVVPSGIDFSPFEEARDSDYLRRELGFAPDDYLVGIVAHLADHKGHKYLIEAADILKSRAPQIKLVIVGEGPLRMELGKLAKETRVEDIVYFLGFREDIPEILGSLDLFVLSSKLEGMGSSLLDAMASSLPIVATRVGGIPEVVRDGETGLLVPPKHSDRLADAILKLYGDRELARRLGQRGYELVHGKFSAAAMAGKIIDVYEDLARKKCVELD